MRRSVLVVLMLFFLSEAYSQGKLKEISPVERINPLTGTVAKGKWYGRTFPGATVPFGLLQLSPDTYTSKLITTGYSFEHTTMEGFSFLHLSGVGWFGEFGNLLVTPTNGPLKTSKGGLKNPENGYRSRFRHESEKASAGYYGVTLDDYKVKAEMSVAQHSGMLKFTFNEEDPTNRIQIDLARRIGGTSTRQYIKVIDDTHIEGWMECNTTGGGWGNGRIHDAKYTVFFSAEFSEPFDTSGIWSAEFEKGQKRKAENVESKKYQEIVANSKIIKGIKEFEGDHVGFFANYPNLRKGDVVKFKAGVSFVDLKGARNNLKSEMNHWDFNKVKTEAKEAWSKALEVIKIEDKSELNKEIFYTSMYHAMIDPRRFTDVDGRYYGGDHKIHEKSDFTARTVFSGWDAFRSHIPLLTIIDPESTSDLVNSLIEVAKYGGQGLPKWEIVSSYSNCMLGDPALPVIIDAYKKGIQDFDINEAYKQSKITSLGPSIRNKWKEYNELGYVSCDTTNRWRGYYKGVSATLENAYADWCVAEFAKELGKDEDYKKFSKRAQNYKNIYSEEVGFFRGRMSDGSWLPWVDKTTSAASGCIESNPLQQLWFVPHDIEGLQHLMGKDRFLSELEEMFNNTPLDFEFNDFYNHANEPVHHVPYLFNYTDKPYLTQKWVRIIMDNAYGTGPYGIKGNEDVGQMSAWYILSAMGFHPVAPGDNKYQLGSPLFDEVIIKLDSNYYSGKTFKITSNNNSKENVYVQSVSLNGKKLNRSYITHDEIVNGGELVFEMANSPKIK